MIFYRINFLLSFMLVFVSLAWGAPRDNDIENRFIYADYSKKISMDFKDASLTDVLKIFSRQSDMNFISAQDVSSKKITLFLDNVPVEEALDKILDANDLTYEMSPNSDVFIVKPKPKDQKITKVFALKYATVDSSKLNSSFSGSIAAMNGSGGASSAGSSNTVKGIADAVKEVLSKDGKLDEDPRTNSLIVTDIPEQFPLIEETIAKLDVPVLQVLIEVEMLDVSKNSADQIGVSYGQTPIRFSGAQRTLLYPFNQNALLQKGATITSSSSSSSGSSTNGLSYTTGILDFSGMTAALDFLRSQTDTRSLARPKLLTLNNQPAEIQITTHEAIGLSSVTNSTSSASSQTIATAERADTGVSLRVTPQANAATGEIILAVTPKVTEAKQGGTFNGQTFKDPEERASQSILRVKNGETVMIGGLLRDESQKTITKLPFLGDLPLVGAAFRHKDKTVSERELIIFITPYILDDKMKLKLDNEAAVRIDREVTAP